MPLPLAYFLTWTTKGSWLHGDVRGSVNRKQNKVGSPLVPPSPACEAREVAMIGHDGILLSPGQRNAIDNALREHCAFRRWSLLALNVRTQHVHLVVRTDEVAPERVMSDCKARATRVLREAHLIDPSLKLWTTHGSTRWINDAHALARAIEYVLHEQ